MTCEYKKNNLNSNMPYLVMMIEPKKLKEKCEL